MVCSENGTMILCVYDCVVERMRSAIFSFNFNMLIKYYDSIIFRIIIHNLPSILGPFLLPMLCVCLEPRYCFFAPKTDNDDELRCKSTNACILIGAQIYPDNWTHKWLEATVLTVCVCVCDAHYGLPKQPIHLISTWIPLIVDTYLGINCSAVEKCRIDLPAAAVAAATALYAVVAKASHHPRQPQD